MKLIIDPGIIVRFPNARLAVMSLHGIQNRTGGETIVQLGKAVEAGVNATFKDIPPRQHPFIEPWRKAYREFGSNPQEYRSSIEALVRQVIRGRDFWGINPLVDAYNLVSLKYLLPVGGEDLVMVSGDIRLAFSKGDEAFIRLGGSANEPPEPGEVVYKDDLGAICRRWNWREADRTKLTETTTDAVIVIEAIDPAASARLQAAAEDLSSLVQSVCGGRINTTILKEGNLDVDL